MARFIVVLDSNRDLDPHNWPASAVAASEGELVLQHDGTCTNIPRRPGDHRIKDVRVVNKTTGAVDSAGIYSVA